MEKQEKSILLSKFEKIKGFSNNLFDNKEWAEFDVFCNEQDTYTPKVGDLFKWGGQEYFCIESSEKSGTVNPIGETFYQRDFYWNFEGITPVFIRKATDKELENMGIDEVLA